MRAAIITKPGGPEVLQIADIEQPVPQGDEVLVKVQAAGLNRADLSQRLGRYPAPAGVRQDVPGLEFAGVVAAVGQDARTWQAGQRVFGIVAGGGQAEYVLSHTDLLAAIPPNLDFATAAAVPEVFMTAYDALEQGGLAAGKRVLIHAVGSGVGTAALQLAQAAGATVFGTARTASKLEQAQRLGLERGFLSDTWPQELLEATNNNNDGVDIILDFVGASYLKPNLEVLAPRGRIVVIGTLGGSQGEIDLRQLMGKRAQLIGTVLRSRPRSEKALLTAAFAEHVVPLLARGEIVPVIDRIFALDEIQEAHRYMETNANFGKIVLQVATKA